MREINTIYLGNIEIGFWHNWYISRGYWSFDLLRFEYGKTFIGFYIFNFTLYIDWK